MRFFLFIVLFLVACNSSQKSAEKAENYTKDELKTLAFLSEKDQFLDANYYSEFYKFYDRKIKTKNLKVIREAIENTCDNENFHQSYNKEFKNKITHFHQKYVSHFNTYDWLFYYNYLGNYYFEISDYDKANHYYDQVNSVIPRDENSMTTIAYSITDQAFCEAAAGHYFNALQLNYKSIPMFKKLNNETGYATAIMNIGLINLFTKDYGKAKFYLHQAGKIYYDIEDFRNYITCLHNSIIVYEDSNDPSFFNKIKEVYDEFEKYDLKDLTIEISIKTYYVRYLIHQKNFIEVEKLLTELKSKLDKIDSEYSEIEYMVANGEYEMAKLGHLKNTLPLKRMIEKIGKSENYQNQIALYELLIKNEIAQGNWENAYNYSTKLTSSNENFSNDASQKLSQEMQESYQKKQLEETIQVKNKVINNKNIWIYGLLTMVSISLVLFILFVFRRKQYNLRKDNIRNQKFTRQLIVEIEEERRRISADLHDSVNHDLLNIKRGLVQNNLPQAKLLENVINDIRNISRNIHPVLFQQIGFTASLKNLINTVEASHTIPIISEIQYQQSFDTFQELNLYRIIQECLSNAIKYSQAHAIQIVITDSKNNFEMTIKDNGQGFDLKKTLATKNVFGLESIYNRAKILGCNCTIISSQKGTSITIKKTK